MSAVTVFGRDALPEPNSVKILLSRRIEVVDPIEIARLARLGVEHEGVPARTAMELVVACTAKKDVVAVVPEQRIGAGVALQAVGGGIALELVVKASAGGVLDRHAVGDRVAAGDPFLVGSEAACMEVALQQGRGAKIDDDARGCLRCGDRIPSM
jgi:hypothetical protein